MMKKLFPILFLLFAIPAHAGVVRTVGKATGKAIARSTKFAVTTDLRDVGKGIAKGSKAGVKALGKAAKFTVHGLW